jgi:hypothetical protein
MFFDDGNGGDETDIICVSSYVVNLNMIFFKDNQLCLL